MRSAPRDSVIPCRISLSNTTMHVQPCESTPSSHAADLFLACTYFKSRGTIGHERINPAILLVRETSKAIPNTADEQGSILLWSIVYIYSPRRRRRPVSRRSPGCRAGWRAAPGAGAAAGGRRGRRARSRPYCRARRRGGGHSASRTGSEVPEYDTAYCSSSLL